MRIALTARKTWTGGRASATVVQFQALAHRLSDYAQVLRTLACFDKDFQAVAIPNPGLRSVAKQSLVALPSQPPGAAADAADAAEMPQAGVALAEFEGARTQGPGPCSAQIGYEVSSAVHAVHVRQEEYRKKNFVLLQGKRAEEQALAKCCHRRYFRPARPWTGSVDHSSISAATRHFGMCATLFAA